MAEHESSEQEGQEEQEEQEKQRLDEILKMKPLRIPALDDITREAVRDMFTEFLTNGRA